MAVDSGSLMTDDHFPIGKNWLWSDMTERDGLKISPVMLLHYRGTTWLLLLDLSLNPIQCLDYLTSPQMLCLHWCQDFSSRFFLFQHIPIAPPHRWAVCFQSSCDNWQCLELINKWENCLIRTEQYTCPFTAKAQLTITIQHFYYKILKVIYQICEKSKFTFFPPDILSYSLIYCLFAVKFKKYLRKYFCLKKLFVETWF